MNDAVVDTSILMAILRNEKIDEQAHSVMKRGVISTVNLAEFYTNLSPSEGRSTPPIHALLSTLRVEVFTEKQAQIAGSLRAATRHAGLSLGTGRVWHLAWSSTHPYTQRIATGSAWM